jgi:hypothetical protein
MTRAESPEEARRRLGITDFFQHQPVRDGKAGRRPCKVCHSGYDGQVMRWFGEGLSYQKIADKLTAITGIPYSDMNVHRHVHHTLERKHVKRNV